MHSGGDTKEPPYERIYIEAPEKEAEIIFYNRFGHAPHRVSCTCCGADYSLTESPTLEQASSYERNCVYAYFHRKTGEEWVKGPEHDPYDTPDLKFYEGRYVERKAERSWRGPHVPLEVYVTNHNVLVIYEKNIKPEERIGDVPEQGFVWVD